MPSQVCILSGVRSHSWASTLAQAEKLQDVAGGQPVDLLVEAGFKVLQSPSLCMPCALPERAYGALGGAGVRRREIGSLCHVSAYHRFHEGAMRRASAPSQGA